MLLDVTFLKYKAKPFALQVERYTLCFKTSEAKQFTDEPKLNG